MRLSLHGILYTTRSNDLPRVRVLPGTGGERGGAAQGRHHGRINLSVDDRVPSRFASLTDHGIRASWTLTVHLNAGGSVSRMGR